MSQQELLKRVIEVLDSCGIAYMVTGSFASGLYGEPRSTHDIDLVVQMSASHIDSLMDEFPSPSYFLQRESIRSAISVGKMFNLLSIDSGDKVDFWMVTSEPFDQARFSRRVAKKIAGVQTWVSSPEDTILAKLRWSQLAGGNEKQLTDVLRIYEVQRGMMDETYIEEWAARLEVADSWREIQSAARPIDSGEDKSGGATVN